MDAIENTLLIGHCVKSIIYVDCKSFSAKTVMVMLQVNRRTLKEKTTAKKKTGVRFTQFELHHHIIECGGFPVDYVKNTQVIHSAIEGKAKLRIN